MAIVTRRQKLVLVLALLAAVYFLLILTPAFNNYAKKEIYLGRVSTWYAKHFQGRNHSSERTGSSVTPGHVVQTTEVQTADAKVIHSPERTESKLVTPDEHLVKTTEVQRTAGVRSAEATKVNLKTGNADRCNYKVQVYDTANHMVVKLAYDVIGDLLKHSKKVGRYVQANVTCPSYDCDIQVTIADDKNRFADMDAVLYHVFSIMTQPFPPTHLNQTCVFASWEAPRYFISYGQNWKLVYVDATWSYSRASEITHPYGFYIPTKPAINQTKSVDEWLKGKTKLIAWMASNCGVTGWPRLKFVKELRKFIPVDAYGGCGNLTCLPRNSPKCTVDLMRQYKFYLSLENAECEDYITEKVWQKPLMQGVVPIVYGPRRKIYEELLPPNSFIYVGDFKSIKELAEYLKLLDSKPELYVRYLEWQYKGSISDWFVGSGFCSLIPVIEKGKKGQLKRTPLTDTKFYQSCRKAGEFDAKSTAFGLDKWNPW